MSDVFISYSKTNEPLVRRLAEAVRRLGYTVWWDEELPPHLSYSDVITSEIGRAEAVIVVWSEASIASEWVRAEADLARNQKKLVQTSIDGRMPPMPFNQLHFVSIADWEGEQEHPGWSKVKASLEALVRPAAPTASTAPPGAALPPPAAVPKVPHKWHSLLIGVIAVAFLFIAGAGLFAWLRGGAATTPVQAPLPAARPAADEPRPQPAVATPARTSRVAPAPPQSAKPARARASPRLGEIRRAQHRARYGRRR